MVRTSLFVNNLTKFLFRCKLWRKRDFKHFKEVLRFADIDQVSSQWGLGPSWEEYFISVVLAPP